METQNSSYWAPVAHEDPRKATQDEGRSNVYNMYPMNWALASDAQRDAEEARQRRSRENNGGLGFTSDFGTEYQTNAVEPQHQLSAGIAAVSLEVSLDL